MIAIDNLALNLSLSYKDTKNSGYPIDHPLARYYEAHFSPITGSRVTVIFCYICVGG